MIVGESGAGKTTLLRLLAGLERPDAGRITAGAVFYDGSGGIDVPAWRRSIGYVSQDYALFPHLSVFENVAFGLRASGVAAAPLESRVREALTRVGIAELMDRRPGELSGGQQQRVALARALVLEPDLLLLDEPLSALDLRTRQTVRGELRRLFASLRGVTIYVTHHPMEAMMLGDRIAALEQGRLTQVGTRDELLRRPRSPYVAAFLGINLLRGSIVGRQAGMARIRTAGGEISAVDPGGDEDVFLVVHPQSIALFHVPPGGSAQNTFVGPIVEIVPEPPHGERVRVVLGTKPPLVAEVTDRAVEQLGLREGVEVHATFKATGVDVFR